MHHGYVYLFTHPGKLQISNLVSPLYAIFKYQDITDSHLYTELLGLSSSPSLPSPRPKLGWEKT